MTIRMRVFLLASSAALLVSACTTGQETDTPAPPTAEQTATAEFNETDVAFAQMMIPHHEQAVEMSRLAVERAGADVRELAEQIEAAQGPEIEQMTTLLESWGEEPAGGGHGMPHADHGMPGMMSDEQMTELRGLQGDAFDTRFLEMMIAHHEGAVEMAEQELADGVNPEARQLARDIVETQEAEIEQMRGMLETSSPDNDGR
ncbi:DUF305 domain-containing protein [Thermobifida alba]|uniref:DUF305 domain-containing protein n=1 Tax=Thermobifida alba TaxID=53522 RepID=A0ABY4KZ12_THEAE|nr:DUF305 domain-containing protein [Thermobifida alba]UPT20666.1 DUF305 domain-containing protein [Thermobifida alba]